MKNIIVKNMMELQWESETLNKCKERLDALSCEEIASINIIDKFEEVV